MSRQKLDKKTLVDTSFCKVVERAVLMLKEFKTLGGNLIDWKSGNRIQTIVRHYRC